MDRAQVSRRRHSRRRAAGGEAGGDATLDSGSDRWDLHVSSVGATVGNARRGCGRRIGDCRRSLLSCSRRNHLCRSRSGLLVERIAQRRIDRTPTGRSATGDVGREISTGSGATRALDALTEWRSRDADVGRLLRLPARRHRPRRHHGRRRHVGLGRSGAVSDHHGSRRRLHRLARPRHRLRRRCHRHQYESRRRDARNSRQRAAMNLQLNLDELRFDPEKGTVVVVAQDAVNGKVLMVANADRQALERTLETGDMHYRSRSRGLWRKGETSGNLQRVVSLAADCDGDTVLARVISAGPACHTGAPSCFDDSLATPSVWSALATIIASRHAELLNNVRANSDTQSPSPQANSPSYTAKLLRDRNLRLKKIGEESGELIAAVADGDADRSAEEAADLVYHVAVALEAIGSSLDEVALRLFNRSGKGSIGSVHASSIAREVASVLETQAHQPPDVTSPIHPRNPDERLR